MNVASFPIVLLPMLTPWRSIVPRWSKTMVELTQSIPVSLVNSRELTGSISIYTEFCVIIFKPTLEQLTCEGRPHVLLPLVFLPVRLLLIYLLAATTSIYHRLCKISIFLGGIHESTISAPKPLKVLLKYGNKTVTIGRSADLKGLYWGSLDYFWIYIELWNIASGYLKWCVHAPWCVRA